MMEINLNKSKINSESLEILITMTSRSDAEITNRMKKAKHFYYGVNKTVLVKGH